jgi:Tol biopolymer transport system component
MIRPTLQSGLACCAAWLASGIVAGCAAPTEPATGAIEVTSSTAGEPLDPDGYVIVLDQGEQQLITANGSLTLEQVSAGEHQVSITGIAPHCILSDPGPRTLSVARAEVSRVSFEVQCSTPTGAVDVKTQTTGETPDPDGYFMSLDGKAAQAIPTSGSTVITGVIAGVHRVTLTGIAANCSVAGENPGEVTVAGDTAGTTFEINCHQLAGAVLVRTVTSGIAPDPDGYTLSLDDGAAQAIASTATVTMPGVVPGEHTVLLSGLAPNCAVSGDNPQVGTVKGGATLQMMFLVSCRGAGSSTLLIASDRSGTSRLYSVGDDGSHLLNLTPSVAAFDGDWSPDGSRIVVSTASGLQLRNADGSQILNLGVSGNVPRWSPDGAKIAFESNDSIRIVNADGSGIVSIARGRRPDWSPDGSRILFDRSDGQRCFFDLCLPILNLYVSEVDGSQVQRLVAGAECGAWAPDGRSVVFHAPFDGLYLAKPDGTVLRHIASSTAGCPVVWSPDGAALAYAAAQPDGSTEVTLMLASGGGGVVVATGRGSEFPEAWK